MHFDIYLRDNLKKNGLSKSEFARILDVNRSTITNYINGTRFPIDKEHENLKKTIKYFSKSKSKQAKDLHFIFFGDV